MTDEKIIELVKLNFGSPVVEVYTPDESIKSFIDQGFDLLSSYVNREIRFVLPLKPINQLDPSEIRFVIDVVPYVYTTNPKLNYVRDDFTLAEAMEYFNVYSQSLMVPILATMTYNQLHEAFNMKFDWHYDNISGKLYTENIPVGASCLTVVAKTYYTRETLEKDLESWLLKYTLARTKIVEGRIRGKYKEGSVGAVSDGDALVAEGNVELQAAEEQINNFVTLNVGRRR